MLSLLRMIQNVDLLWRHRYKTGRQQLWHHNDRLFPRGCYGRFLSIFCDPRVSTRGIASNNNNDNNNNDNNNNDNDNNNENNNNNNENKNKNNNS